MCCCVCCCLYFKKRGYASSSSSFFSTPFGMIPSSASLFAFSSAGVGAILPQEVENPLTRPSFARWLSTVLLVTETFIFLTLFNIYTSLEFYDKSMMHRFKLLG